MCAVGTGEDWYAYEYSFSDGALFPEVNALLYVRYPNGRLSPNGITGNGGSETIYYLDGGLRKVGAKSVVACAFMLWAGSALLLAAAGVLGAVATGRARCRTAVPLALGWAGCIFLLIGFTVALAKFALRAEFYARFIEGGETYRAAAGPPLVGVGLVFAVATTALASVAAAAAGSPSFAITADSLPGGSGGDYAPAGGRRMVPSPLAGATGRAAEVAGAAGLQQSQSPPGSRGAAVPPPPLLPLSTSARVALMAPAPPPHV
jgi:hypothetical protein